MQQKSPQFIIPFKQVRIDDVPKVGGKNASLGQMISQLHDKGVRVPDGFAITADAYWHYLNANGMVEQLKKIMGQLTDTDNMEQLKKVGEQARALIVSGTIPEDLAQEVATAYKNLSAEYKQDACDVAVRSSATAEDLPTASFAGQQETYLHVRGVEQVLASAKKSFASLFTDRAI